MSVNLTEEQRAAIASRGKVIVSASAGSGKTFVMIERLVRLIVEEGADISNVLCMTFTNKAAAQMRERLRNALVKKIAETDGATRDRLKRQLNDLPLADICTIHAFCGRLVRSRFYLCGLDPAFRIIAPDDADGTALSARAIDEVFERAYERGDERFYDLLGAFFRHKRDARLRAHVQTLYRAARACGDPLVTLQRVGDDYFETACEEIKRDYIDRANYFRDALEDMSAFCAEHNACAMKLVTALYEACSVIIECGDLFEIVALQKPAIPNMPPMSKATGEEAAVLKKLSAISKGVKGMFAEFGGYDTREVEHARCENARLRAAALAELAVEYDAIYGELKREKGVLDYDDLERYAMQILDNADALAELKQKYRYLFVDEYQDVNPVQEALVSKLTENEVFLVGDSKQAIYGFRGSRSVYFTNKVKEIDALCLSRNFRSADGVLCAVNRVFGKLIADYVPMTGGDRYGEHGGETCFRILPEKEKPERERGVYSVLDPAEEEVGDPLSDEVVRLIDAELGKTYYDADAGEEKKVEFKDIAVLVRKNTGDSERIVRALTARGIAVTTSARVNICKFFEVRLLLDWLSFLDNGEQDIPLGTAMLSAFGGFSIDDLTEIRLRFVAARSAPYFFREAVKRYRETAGNALARRLADFEEKVKLLRARAQVRTAAEIMNDLLAAGLEVQIAQKGGVQARLAHVNRLIGEAGEDSVNAFLRRLKASGERIDFSEVGGENAVKILTMHASKGLEFPVVILTGLDTPFHGVERDEIMWTEKYTAALKCYDLREKSVSETLVRRASQICEERQRVEEECNLLYVAMTRAKYRLHLLFAGREQSLPRFASRFSDFIDMQDTADLFVEREEADAATSRRSLVYRPDPETEAKILAIYKSPYAHEAATALPVKSSATKLMQEKLFDDADDAFDGWERREGKGFSREEGLAYHAFLQHVRFGCGVREELDRMARENLLSPEALALLKVAQLEKILSIPCMSVLAGKRVYREKTFLMGIPAREVGLAEADDEVVFQGAIDLLSEEGDGFLIIDYKYSALDDGHLKKKYAVQIAIYKKAVARAMRVAEESVRCRIVNIAKGREIEM